ncbi:MAG: hypothetical protein V3V08_00665 [Nannocystaceae bacterium]
MRPPPAGRRLSRRPYKAFHVVGASRHPELPAIAEIVVIGTPTQRNGSVGLLLKGWAQVWAVLLILAKMSFSGKRWVFSMPRWPKEGLMLSFVRHVAPYYVVRRNAADHVPQWNGKLQRPFRTPQCGKKKGARSDGPARPGRGTPILA